MDAKRTRQLSPRLTEALGRRGTSSEVTALLCREGLWTLRTLAWLPDGEVDDIKAEIVQVSDRRAFDEIVAYAKDVSTEARWRVRAGHVPLGIGTSSECLSVEPIASLGLPSLLLSSPPPCTPQWSPPPLPAASVDPRDEGVRKSCVEFVLANFEECATAGKLWSLVADLSREDRLAHMEV